MLEPTMTPQEEAEWVRRAKAGRLEQNKPLVRKPKPHQAFEIGSKKISPAERNGSETKPKPAATCPKGGGHHWKCETSTWKGAEMRTPAKCKKCKGTRVFVQGGMDDFRAFHQDYDR